MKDYRIIKKSSFWSVEKLTNEVEILLNEKTSQGYEVISVSFGVNLFWIPTAFITLKK